MSEEQPKPVVNPERVREIERRIDAGEFDDGSFHRFVAAEIYPLLGEGELDEAAFTALVVRYAHRSYPFDWPLAEFPRSQ